MFVYYFRGLKIGPWMHECTQWANVLSPMECNESVWAVPGTLDPAEG